MMVLLPNREEIPNEIWRPGIPDVMWRRVLTGAATGIGHGMGARWAFARARCV